MLRINHSLIPSVRLIKNAVRCSGSNLTKNHVALVSQVAFVMDAVKKMDNVLGSSKMSSHTMRQCSDDLKKMCAVLIEKGLVEEREGRRMIKGEFKDPRRAGIMKIETGWLADFLKKSSEICDSDIELDGLNLKTG